MLAWRATIAFQRKLLPFQPDTNHCHSKGQGTRQSNNIECYLPLAVGLYHLLSQPEVQRYQQKVPAIMLMMATWFAVSIYS